MAPADLHASVLLTFEFFEFVVCLCKVFIGLLRAFWFGDRFAVCLAVSQVFSWHTIFNFTFLIDGRLPIVGEHDAAIFPEAAEIDEQCSVSNDLYCFAKSTSCRNDLFQLNFR